MLPMGEILSINMGYGLSGLWFSLSFAWLVSTVVYLTVVLRTDWSTQIVVTNDGLKGPTDDVDKFEIGTPLSEK
jgi:Na+-driven multidrug efflux pump